MQTYIAIAILVGAVYLGIVVFRKGTVPLFLPGSRASQGIKGSGVFFVDGTREK